MSSDQPSPSRGSWKLTAASAEKKRALEPRWRRIRETAPASARRPRWTRAAKLGVSTLAFLLVATLLVGGISMLYLPPPICVVPVGAAYEENLVVPLNVYGWQGLKDLA